MVETISELCLFPPKDHILKLAAAGERKSTQGIHRACLAQRRAAMLHRRNAVIDGFADVLEILVELLNVSEGPALFLGMVLQTMFHLVKSIFLVEEVLKEEKNRIYGNQIVNYGMESLDEENRGARIARYSSIKELLLKYMKSDGGRMWSAK